MFPILAKGLIELLVGRFSLERGFSDGFFDDPLVNPEGGPLDQAFTSDIFMIEFSKINQDEIIFIGNEVFFF